MVGVRGADGERYGAPSRVAVCEDLGYPSERVAEGTAEHPPVVQSRLFCVVVGY